MDNSIETRDFDTPAGSVFLPAGYGLEKRQREGPIDVIRGFFPYSSRGIINDRGTVRKEEIAPNAFGYAIDDPEREVSFLYGHNFNDPIASKRAGTLDVLDTPDGVAFEGRLPAPEQRTENQNKLVQLLRQKLIGGLSPGFRIPPATAVGRQPVELVPEKGNPGVQVRRVRDAVLFEISAVQRATYRSVVWMQKSFFNTRLGLGGMLLVSEYLSNLMGKDWLAKLRKDIAGNERIRADDRRDWQDAFDDFMAEGLTPAEAEARADELTANNLALDTRSNRQVEELDVYRWL